MVEYKKFEIVRNTGEIEEVNIRLYPWKLVSGTYIHSTLDACDAVALPRYNNKYGYRSVAKMEAIQLAKYLGVTNGISVSNSGDFWNVWRIRPNFIAPEKIP